MRLLFGSGRLAACAIGLYALAACGDGGHAINGFGPLAPILPKGQDGEWAVEKSGEAFRLSNGTNPGLVRYYYFDSPAEQQGSRTVSTRVSIEAGDGSSRAGLIYGLIQEPRSFYLFTIENDGSIALWKRDETGFNMTMSQSDDRSADKPVTLTIKEDEGQIELLVDSRSIGSVGSATIGRGAVGIAAAGTGRFLFEGFAHSP